MRTIFDKLSYAYVKYYSPTDHLAGNDVIVLFRGRVVFKQFLPKKHKWFGLKSKSCLIVRDIKHVSVLR
jgi:hypothetical protein